MGASGPPTAFQLVTLPVKIASNCGMLSFSIGLLECTYTDNPSMHILYSCGRTLNFLTKSAVSVGFIGREELQMSVVPFCNAAKPVPDPPPVTCTVVPGAFFMYTSAHFWPRITIVSEP